MATTRTYAVGFGGRVVRLDSHAGPWVDITPTFPNQNETAWYDVMSDPLNPDKVTIVGDDTLNSIGSGILVSTDAGVTWNIPGGNWAGKKINFRELWYADSNIIWAVGQSGNVVQSLDGGLTFNSVTRVEAGLDSLTVCIHAIDQWTAVVGGGPTGGQAAQDTYVWKTSDGGVTWVRLNGGNSLRAINPASPVGIAEGIWISDDEQKIVVGTGYTQNVSTDGGNTFTSIAPEITRQGVHLTWYPAHDPNPANMWHVGGSSSIQVNQSTNNGNTWSTLRSGDNILIRGAQFYSANDGYYIVNGTVFSTSDSGLTGTTSYTTPDGDLLTAVWTGTDPAVDPGCPCYLATNCDDPNDTLYITIDCTIDSQYNPLDPNTTYQFNIPGLGDDPRCWTVEEIECPVQQTIDLGSGNVSEGVPGVYNDQDYQWQVVDIVVGATPQTTPPFPARIADQTWYPGNGDLSCNPPNYPSWGSQVGGQWITVGQSNDDGSTPHTQNIATAAYELQFTPPANFIPILHLEFLIDNTATFYLNGVPLTPSNSPTCPWDDPYIIDIDGVNNPGATFNVGLNTLRVETVNSGGSGTNGINIIGEISNANPPSVEVTVISSWDDCDACLNPIVPNTCWDLEVVCDGLCPDVFAINSFDFTPYIGQNITIQPPLSTDPECWYTPHLLRQAIFIAAPETTGGGYNLSWPFSTFQQGTDDITISIPSLVFNGIEQISGTPPSYLLTPGNIQFVNCQQMNCTNVPINNPGGLTGYANTVDFINTVLATLGINTIQVYNNSFDNCPIVQIKPRETVRVQYRDGDTFRFTLQLSNVGQGVNTIVYEVQAGNVTISYLNSPSNPLNTCNDNIYCLTDPADSPTINGVTIVGDCPVEPIDLGEACEITPRLGEPGFSTKNCDPKKVIDVKTKFANSVYALFKRARYGIETCCEFDLDKIDIKNQLIDLGSKYDPDMCINGTPINEECCLQPCDAVATILVPNFLSCPAPTDPITAIIVPGPVITACDAPQPLPGQSGVRGTVTIN